MKQWITEDGEFDVDFIKEISAKYNVDDLKKSYGALFKNHFGVDLDDFTLL
ncbi:hypothetical protein [Escherichia coli]|nr:hypothetical protein [Escherichia coli]EKX2427731.1 hypothetical protein [Escherichia coli]UUQ03787.1 hypothetical protein KFU72_09165 [Escherichia coli]